MGILLVYYRIFAEDGAIPSKTPANPGDPFLGRIKARSIPPPHLDRDTAKTIKLSIAKAENIIDLKNTRLFLTPHSQLPMGDSDKVTALNRISSGPGSTPQDPLAFVAKISGSPLESGGRGGLESSVEPYTTPDSETRYRTSIQRHLFFVLTSRLLREVYYMLYDYYEISSKVAFDPKEPALGRIRTDSVAPPRNQVTIKACISRVERTPAIASANLFADISSNTPMKEDLIPFLPTDCPGLSPENPMAVVLTPQSPPALIADGRYVIKNRAAAFFWRAYKSRERQTVGFYYNTIAEAKRIDDWYSMKVNYHSPIIQAFSE